MSSCLVYSTNQHSHTKWSFAWHASLNLTLVSNLDNEPFGWMVAAMGIPVIDTLLAHVVAQESTVSRHARNNNSQVLVDIKNLFLMDS
jgi:hypothetical protein